MKLRLKVILILSAMWLIVSGVVYFYSRYILSNEYIALESHQLRDDINTTNKTLVNMMSSLKLLNTDWAEWDDLYQFMVDKNPTFIKSNMAFTSFDNAKLNLILFYDNDGKLFYGKYYNLTNKEFESLPTAFLKQLEAEKIYTQNTDPRGKLGIFKTSNGYVVLSVKTILNSQKQGPSRGNLIMAYFFDEKQLIKLADTINMHVALYPLPLQTDTPSIVAAYHALQSGNAHFIAPSHNKQLLYGYTMIKDIEGDPIGILRITSPRTIYIQGMNTINQYLMIIFIVGFVFIGIIWYLLKTLILDQVLSISNCIVSIQKENNFTKRIATKRNDELGAMVNSFNSLMEIMQLTENQLKYRIFQRTEELEELAKKNKNLYEEVTKQKQVEEKLRDNEKSLRIMAYYDTLTGLPNRLFFNEMMEKTLKKSHHDGSNFALLFLDLDNFKHINDTYGHDMGDKYLKHIASLLKNTLKESDIAARLAGDEFLICLTQIRGNALISKVAGKILQAVATPLIINDAVVTTTASIGISVYPNDGETVEDLEHHADNAMYYAKKNRGNAYAFYHETSEILTT